MSRWRRWARIFDPRRSLTFEEVGTLYEQRARAPHQEIARRLRRTSPGEPAIKAVVVGSRGSGKSTELARVAYDLRQEYLSVRMDLAGSFDAQSSAMDLLVLIAAAVLRTARDWRAKTTPTMTRMQGAIERIGVTAEAFAGLVGAFEPVGALVGTPGVLKGAGGLLQAAGALSRQYLKTLNREAAATEQSALVESLNGAILDLHVDGVNDLPALFLLEGLDKLTDLQTIRAAFRDVDLLTAIDAPLVLTAPVAVRHQPWVASGALRKFDLWNAAVVTHDGRPHTEGIGQLVGMLQRRLDAAAPDRKLLSDTVARDAAFHSSGNAREFFRLLEGAMDRADELDQPSITKKHLEHAITARRHELQLALRSEQLQVLVDLLKSPTSVPAGADADELLYENFVACYPNEDAWFRPHEILVPYLERLRSGSERA